ncbi:type I secretion protein TolC [Mycobacterium sp. DSM 3803]|nr:type I secretion protein TolC [Mycobacterium sp. DSM 3803]
MTLTDDEYVARAEGAIAHWRARNRAFNEAIARIEIDPVDPDVYARFDSNRTLVEFEVSTRALRTYTNTELEELIRKVLVETSDRMTAQFEALHAKYLQPNSPTFDPDILGEPYVVPPPV